jgi:hypothetical protein
MYQRLNLVLLSAIIGVFSASRLAANNLHYIEIVPEFKLAVCLILKSGWTTSRRFLFRAQRNPAWNAHDIWNYTKFPLASIATLSNSEIKTALTSPEWTRLVIYRDPVERFASGFLDKCTRKPEWNGKYCCTHNCPVRNADGSGGSLRQVLDTVENHISTSTSNTTTLDEHFRPTAWLCGLDDAAIRANFKVISFKSMADDYWRAIMAARGIPKSRRSEVALAARELFASQSKQKYNRHTTRSEKLVNDWRAAEADPQHPEHDIPIRLRAMYAMDYAAFGSR